MNAVFGFLFLYLFVFSVINNHLILSSASFSMYLSLMGAQTLHHLSQFSNRLDASGPINFIVLQKFPPKLSDLLQSGLIAP